MPAAGVVWTFSGGSGMDGVQEGDFAMIFGFPGQTQRYLSSYAVDYVMNTADPLRIRVPLHRR